MADMVPQFKSQPWTLFDTIASTDFTCGSATPAIGQQTPAISANGEIVFFQSAGRLAAGMPWYTNLDQLGTLSYGFEVWAIYFILLMPKTPAALSFGHPGANAEVNLGPSSVEVLAQAILQFGELEVMLGQEMQIAWPLTRFGAGGGFYGGNTYSANPQSSVPASANIMQLPEPIEMPRTQVMNAKIRLAPEAVATIGRPTALGAGAPLDPTQVEIDAAPVDVAFPPYAIQVGYIGRRIKDTQYGQLAG